MAGGYDAGYVGAGAHAAGSYGYGYGAYDAYGYLQYGSADAAMMPYRPHSSSSISVTQAWMHATGAPIATNERAAAADAAAHDTSSTISTAPSLDSIGPPSSGDEESAQSHECQTCGKEFRRNSDLTKHRRYHTKEFSCQFPSCQKAFATGKDLKRHEHTHKRDSGFRCPVSGCGKARSGHVYNRRDNFIRHLRTKHATHPGLEEQLQLLGRGQRGGSSNASAESAAAAVAAAPLVRVKEEDVEQGRERSEAAMEVARGRETHSPARAFGFAGTGRNTGSVFVRDRATVAVAEFGPGTEFRNVTY